MQALANNQSTRYDTPINFSRESSTAANLAAV